MDSRYIENTKRQLHRRVDRLLSCDIYVRFGIELKMLIDWVNANTLTASIVGELSTETAIIKGKIGHLSETSNNGNAGAIIIPQNFREECALAWFMINKIANEITPPRYDRPVNLLATYGKILGEPGHRQAQDMINFFRLHTIVVIRDYFDEQIDNRNVKLYLLRKYKLRCEQFRRNRLQDIAKNGIEKQKTGEKSLCVDLYEFLHDQGLEFSREPDLSAGWVDLLAKDLLIDAKFIKADASESEIISTVSDALRQVKDYCAEADQSVGYVLCFNAAGVGVHIEEELELGSFRFVELGGFHIHYMEVDICDYGGKSASKRGRATVVRVPALEPLKSKV